MVFSSKHSTIKACSRVYSIERGVCVCVCLTIKFKVLFNCRMQGNDYFVPCITFHLCAKQQYLLQTLYMFFLSVMIISKGRSTKLCSFLPNYENSYKISLLFFPAYYNEILTLLCQESDLMHQLTEARKMNKNDILIWVVWKIYGLFNAL